MLLVAALLHDTGKANEHFQALMRSRQVLQAIRHEQISYWLTRKMLNADTDLSARECEMVAWAVLGHHRKFPDDTRRDGLGTTVSLHPLGEDFWQLARPLGVGSSPVLPSEARVSDREQGSLPRQLRADSVQADLEFQDWTPAYRAQLGLLKNSLILADILGSATGRNCDLMVGRSTSFYFDGRT